MSDGNEGDSSGSTSQVRLLVPVKASDPGESTANHFSARPKHGDYVFQENKVTDRRRIANYQYASDGHDTALETNEVRADSAARLGTRNPAWGEEVVTLISNIEMFDLNMWKNVLRV